MTAEYGDNVSLGSPSVWDNTDSSPKVGNNAPSSYHLGLNTITWTATDNWGNRSSCAQKVNVVDSEAPAITCPADITVNLSDAVNLGSPAATDNADADLEISVDRPESFETGTTLVVWQAQDDSGNTASCKQNVTVLNETVKEFSVKPDADMLWPPNHKYVTIHVDVSAVTASGKDVSDTVKLLSVTSDEPEEIRENNSKKNKGDGNTVNDIVILDDNTVQLRAERLGNGDGRVYTFHYTLTDAAGNTHTATAGVSVPHSIKKPAIDSGVHYAVKP